MSDWRIVQETLIHRQLLDIRRIGPKIIHQLSAVFPIHLMIWRLHHKTGTFAKCLSNRFPCGNTILFCRHRLCQHDSMAAGFISTNDGRNLTDIHVRTIFQFFYRCPAEKRGIYIYMKNYPAHMPPPYPCILLNFYMLFHLFMIFYIHPANSCD